MRRHLPVLSQAFQFYATWIGGLTAVASLGTFALIAALGEWQLGLLGAGAGILAGVLFALPFWWTGRGLRAEREWARWLGIVLSVLVITDIPFGLGLGLLGLGTLLDDEVARAFRGEPQPAAGSRAGYGQVGSPRSLASSIVPAIHSSAGSKASLPSLSP
jgi:hypothetical protein